MDSSSLLPPGYSPTYLDSSNGQFSSDSGDGGGGIGPGYQASDQDMEERRRRALSGDRMVILPRRPSEEPDYVIPSSAMQQLLAERDRARRQQEWRSGGVAGASYVPPTGPENFNAEVDKVSALEKEKRNIHAASEYYRKLREEAARRPSGSMDSLTSPQGSESLSMGSPGPSPLGAQAHSPGGMMGPGLVSPNHQSRHRKNSEPPARVPGDPARVPPHPHQGLGAGHNPNIDLGAVYQQTVENRVTRSFSQHWIIVGKHLRVLLLDFDGKFTLLIPNIDLGKAFRINKADVEVQTKELEGGHKLTFMKFIFQSPALEIKAPVLNDKTVGYQVLQQNGACVFLSRIFNIPSLSSSGSPDVPVPSPATQRFHDRGAASPSQNAHPLHPGQDFRGPPIGHPQSSYSVNGGTQQHLGQPTGGASHLARAMMNLQGTRSSTPGPMQRSQYPEQVQIPSPGGLNPTGMHPLQQSPGNVLSPPPMLQQPPTAIQQMNSVQSMNVLPPHSAQVSPEDGSNTALPPISALKAQYRGNNMEQNSYALSIPDPKPMQNFFELYSALDSDEYAKMTTCSFCQRKFRFTSVLLDHLQSHTPNVENIVEMKMKIWVNGRKLKCGERGCKKKYAYTLDYTKHRDSHPYEGLNCSLCGNSQTGPAEYAMHIAREHQEHLFSTETHADDIPPPVSMISEQTPSPSVSEAQSPMTFNPNQNSFNQDVQVHTPMSAPPIMLASPLTHMEPQSPMQQPMSAPPTVHLTDDLDFGTAINMPILDEEALNPPVQDKENDELMEILNDLKDCTQECDPPNQSPSTLQSNAQIMADLEIQKENLEYNLMPKVEYQTSEPQPIILSQRFPNEINSPCGLQVNSPVQYQHSSLENSPVNPMPSADEQNTGKDQQLYQDINKDHVQMTSNPLVPKNPCQSPGVIRRLSDVTEQTAQMCYSNHSSPSATIMQHVPQMNQGTSHHTIENFGSPLEHQQSPLATHSYPTDNIIPKAKPGRSKCNSFSHSFESLETINQNSQMRRTKHNSYSHSLEDFSTSHEDVASLVENLQKSRHSSSNQDYKGTGSHPSPSVRAIVANRILERKSRSLSNDSNKSEPETPVMANTVNVAMEEETQIKSLTQVCETSDYFEEAAEAFLDNEEFQQTSSGQKNSEPQQETGDHIGTCLDISNLVPTTVDEINAPLIEEITETQELSKEHDSNELMLVSDVASGLNGNSEKPTLLVDKTEKCAGLVQSSDEEQLAASGVTCEQSAAAVDCATETNSTESLNTHFEKQQDQDPKPSAEIEDTDPTIIPEEEQLERSSSNYPEQVMTESGMRSPEYQCSQLYQQSMEQKAESTSDTEREEMATQNFENKNDSDEEKELNEPETVTPIKSWLKKHLDSVKEPDNIDNKMSPEKITPEQKLKPIYIVPQEPEERTYSSGQSDSSDDDDSPKRIKKSPKPRGRPAKTDKNTEKKSYETKLSTDEIGGIKLKFMKNIESDFFENVNDLNNSKKPRGRPKGSKNKPKNMLFEVGSKTPKKKKIKPGIPNPPIKIAPTKNTTPSPPNPYQFVCDSDELKILPVSPKAQQGLSYGLAPQLGPSLGDLARPSSGSPRRLSDSSSSGSDSESDQSRPASPDIIVIETVKKAGPPEASKQILKTSFAQVFEEHLEEKKEDFGPILEIAPMPVCSKSEICEISEETTSPSVTLNTKESTIYSESRLGATQSEGRSELSPPHRRDKSLEEGDIYTFTSRSRSSSSTRLRSRSPSPAQPTKRKLSPSQEVIHSHAKIISPCRNLQTSPARSSSRTSLHEDSSSNSSSSSSSDSDSSLDDCRSPLPDIVNKKISLEKKPPIPKLRIKKSFLTQLGSPDYQPVKVLRNQQTKKFDNSSNNLVSKLQSLSCQVNIPRLKFRVLDSNSEVHQNAKIHKEDIQALKDCQLPSEKQTIERVTSNPPIAPIKIRLRTPPLEQSPLQGKSLSSILAEIVTEPKQSSQTLLKPLSDYKLPVREVNEISDVLFSSSLSVSMIALTKFMHQDMCSQIIHNLVDSVCEAKFTCEYMVEQVVEKATVIEDDCVNILDNILDNLIKASDTVKLQKATSLKETKSDPQQDTDQENDNNVEIIHRKEDDSSIELSDSEYNFIADSTSLLNEKPTTAINLSREESLNEFERCRSEKNSAEEIVTANDKTVSSTSNFTTNMTKSKEGKKKKKIPKLVIKPIQPDSSPSNFNESCGHPIEDNHHADNMENKIPSIILKIPKTSLSPTNKTNNLSTGGLKKRSPMSPNKMMRKLNFSMTKTPKVTIKNLKILPPVPPPVQKSFLEVADVDPGNEIISQSDKSDSAVDISKIRIETFHPENDKIVKENKETEATLYVHEDLITSKIHSDNSTNDISMKPTNTSKNGIDQGPKFTKKSNGFPKRKAKSGMKLKNTRIKTKSSISKSSLLGVKGINSLKSSRKITINDSLKKTTPGKKVVLQTPPPLSVINKAKRHRKGPPSKERNEVTVIERESVVTVLKMSEIVLMKPPEEKKEHLNDLEKLLELENRLKDEERQSSQPDRFLSLNKNKNEKECDDSNTMSDQSPIKKQTPEKNKEKAQIKNSHGPIKPVVENSKTKKNVQEIPSLVNNDLEKLLELENKLKVEERQNAKSSQADKSLPSNKYQNGKQLEQSKIVSDKSPIRKTTPKRKKETAPLKNRQGKIKKTQENVEEIPSQGNHLKEKLIQKQGEPAEQKITMPIQSPTPFVARKSLPGETVSFTLPPGGFKNTITEPLSSSEQMPASKPKPLPLSMKIDELFSQYYSHNREDLKSENEPSKDEVLAVQHISEKSEQFHSEQIPHIMDHLLDQVFKISSGRKPLEKEKSTENLADNDSKNYEKTNMTNLNSSEELIYENKRTVNRRTKRRIENLGLNGGYWGDLGVRSDVRERISKQESMEKEEKEKMQINSENNSHVKTTSEEETKKQQPKKVRRGTSLEVLSVSSKKTPEKGKLKKQKSLDITILETAEEKRAKTKNNISIWEDSSNQEPRNELRKSDKIFANKPMENEKMRNHISFNKSVPCDLMADTDSDSQDNFKSTSTLKVIDQQLKNYDNVLDSVDQTCELKANDEQPEKTNNADHSDRDTDSTSLEAVEYLTQNSEENESEDQDVDTQTIRSDQIIKENYENLKMVLEIIDDLILTSTQQRKIICNSLNKGRKRSSTDSKQLLTKKHKINHSETTVYIPPSYPELTLKSDSKTIFDDHGENRTISESEDKRKIILLKNDIGSSINQIDNVFPGNKKDGIVQTMKSKVFISISGKIGEGSNPSTQASVDVVKNSSKKPKEKTKSSVETRTTQFSENSWVINKKHKKKNKQEEYVESKSSSNKEILSKNVLLNERQILEVPEEQSLPADDFPKCKLKDKLEKCSRKMSVIEIKKFKDQEVKINDHVLKDELNVSKESVESNSDIWNSINETILDIKNSTTSAKKIESFNKNFPKKAESTVEKSNHLKDSIAGEVDYSKSTNLHGWPVGLDVKDEFADDNIDIWANTNEIMKEISDTLYDGKSSDDTSPLKIQEEVKTPSDTSSKRSRSKRKKSEQVLGNPDSGKENADTENLDEQDMRITDRVLSPVTKSPISKRIRVTNHKDNRDNDDEAFSLIHVKDLKVTRELKVSEPSTTTAKDSKRRRSYSSCSTDDGLDIPVKIQESSKQGNKIKKSSTIHHSVTELSPSARKQIKIINPSPIDPEGGGDRMTTKTKSSQNKPAKHVSSTNGMIEKNTKNNKNCTPKGVFRKEIFECKQDQKKSMESNSMNSRSNASWTSKTPCKMKTNPSKDILNFLDKEYEHLKKEDTMKSNRNFKK